MKGKLQEWMDKRDLVDADVSAITKVSRPEISRIRRGLCRASVPTAKALHKLTGIPWPELVEAPQPKNGKRGKPARRTGARAKRSVREFQKAQAHFKNAGA